MKQSEFAKLHNVSRKTVTGWKARGWLVMDGDEVDAEASNKNLERYRKTVTRNQGNKSGNRAQSNKNGNNETPSQAAERLISEMGAQLSYDEARTMKENYFALLAKLEYEEKSGQLLPYADMLNDVSNEYARVRTRLLAISPEHGPRLRQIGLSEEDSTFVDALQEVICEAMNELTIDQRKPGKAQV